MQLHNLPPSKHRTAELPQVVPNTCAALLTCCSASGARPDPPGALLADPHAFSEVLLDGIHTHVKSFRLAHAAAPGRVLLVTDTIRAAGLGDGESELGGPPRDRGGRHAE